MELLTKEIKARLLENGRKNAERIADDGNTIDFEPVVKLFTPDAGATWLLTEINPEDPDIAFGLCDLGGRLPRAGQRQPVGDRRDTRPAGTARGARPVLQAEKEAV